MQCLRAEQQLKTAAIKTQVQCLNIVSKKLVVYLSNYLASR